MPVKGVNACLAAILFMVSIPGDLHADFVAALYCLVRFASAFRQQAGVRRRQERKEAYQREAQQMPHQ